MPSGIAKLKKPNRKKFEKINMRNIVTYYSFIVLIVD